MPKKIKIPKYVKVIVRKTLKERENLPKSKKYSLTKKEATKKGINSGVERAKQLSASKYISEEDAKSIIAFYNRFKNCRTSKCEGAINLWGGRRFALFLKKIYS